MKYAIFCVSLSIWFFASAITLAYAPVELNSAPEMITLDPDSYPSGTDLTHVIPQVTLLTAVSADNQWVIPSWYISAVSDSYTSTGSNVFGYLGFASLWDGRRLRMDFAGTISTISIDFISSNNDSGELHIFDNNWHELGTGYMTQTMPAHGIETMTFARPTADIAHAVAYTHGTGFGRLDHLQFSTPVPEPSTLIMLGMGAIGLLGYAWRRRKD